MNSCLIFYKNLLLSYNSRVVSLTEENLSLGMTNGCYNSERVVVI